MRPGGTGCRSERSERARPCRCHQEPGASNSVASSKLSLASTRRAGARPAIAPQPPGTGQAEIVSDREAKTPDAALTTAIQEAAAAKGVLLLKAGLYGNCIRVLCPLVITDEQLAEALGAWEEAIAEASGA